MKYLVIATLLISQAALADELCSSAFDEFQQLSEATQTILDPSIESSYALDANCGYTVKTEIKVSSLKSLPAFMGELTNAKINLDSASRDKVSSYSVTKNSDGSFNQTIVAKKSGISATINNVCKYTKNTQDEIVYSCGLDPKKSSSVLESNTTTITCTNLNDGRKKCSFTTIGKAKAYKKLGITVKGPCDLAAGGAAETVYGVFRLANHMTHNATQSDHSKWSKLDESVYDQKWLGNNGKGGPGHTFYNSASALQDARPGSTKVIKIQ